MHGILLLLSIFLWMPSAFAQKPETTDIQEKVQQVTSYVQESIQNQLEKSYFFQGGEVQILSESKGTQGAESLFMGAYFKLKDGYYLKATPEIALTQVNNIYQSDVFSPFSVDSSFTGETFFPMLFRLTDTDKDVSFRLRLFFDVCHGEEKCQRHKVAENYFFTRKFAWFSPYSYWMKSMTRWVPRTITSDKVYFYRTDRGTYLIEALFDFPVNEGKVYFFQSGKGIEAPLISSEFQNKRWRAEVKIPDFIPEKTVLMTNLYSYELSAIHSEPQNNFPKDDPEEDVLWPLFFLSGFAVLTGLYLLYLKYQEYKEKKKESDSGK